MSISTILIRLLCLLLSQLSSFRSRPISAMKRKYALLIALKFHEVKLVLPKLNWILNFVVKMIPSRTGVLRSSNQYNRHYHKTVESKSQCFYMRNVMEQRNRHKSFFSRSLIDGVLVGLSGPTMFLYPLGRHSHGSDISVNSAWKRVGKSLSDAMNSEGVFLEKREKSDFKTPRDRTTRQRAVG